MVIQAGRSGFGHAGLLEEDLWLARAGLPLTADRIMDCMCTLHSCLCWNADAHKPQRLIEDPTPEQAEILAALGFRMASGVL